MAKPRRVAIVIDLTYPWRHHHGVFAGIQDYASEHPNWTTVVQPRLTLHQLDDYLSGYDGIIARATAPLAEEAARVGLPLVNIWSSSPAKGVPCVFPDFKAAGRMAAEHFLQRGFRRFAFHGFCATWEPPRRRPVSKPR